MLFENFREIAHVLDAAEGGNFLNGQEGGVQEIGGMLYALSIDKGGEGHTGFLFKEGGEVAVIETEFPGKGAETQGVV